MVNKYSKGKDFRTKRRRRAFKLTTPMMISGLIKDKNDALYSMVPVAGSIIVVRVFAEAVGKSGGKLNILCVSPDGDQSGMNVDLKVGKDMHSTNIKMKAGARIACKAVPVNNEEAVNDVWISLLFKPEYGAEVVNLVTTEVTENE